MSRFWIIEAKGKVKAFSEALIEAGFNDDRVLATFGRLFDLPDSLTHIDRELKVIKNLQWKHNRPGQVEKISQMLAHASEVIIATDSDLEGEFIAYQVASKAIPQGLPFFRVHLPAITAEHIRYGYSNKSSINQNKVAAATARRFFDRQLGYQLPSDTDHFRMSMGRIISPIIASLKKKPPIMLHMRRELPGGWVAKLDFPGHFSADATLLCDLLGTLPDCNIRETSRSERIFEKKPLTGSEATVLCARALNKPVKDIAEALQSNYMKSKLSYPRTDSRRLGDISKKWAQRVAEFHGEPFSQDIIRERQAISDENSQDAHEALIPTTTDFADPSIPDTHLNNEDAVLRVIARHTAGIGAAPVKTHLLTGDIDYGPSKQEWQAKLSRFKAFMRFEKIVDAESGRVIEQDEFGRKAQTTRGKASLWVERADVAIAQRMIDERLGRPSTLHLHAEKAMRYVDASARVNRLGMLMLHKVGERLPALIEPGIAQEIEKTLTQVLSPINISQRLNNAWLILRHKPIDNGGKHSPADKPLLTGKDSPNNEKGVLEKTADHREVSTRKREDSRESGGGLSENTAKPNASEASHDSRSIAGEHFDL